MRTADMDVIDREAEVLYELLTEDDALEAQRIQARQRLEQGGVDVDTLTGQFVSHQTMYRHLTNCLGAEHESNAVSISSEREMINGIRTKTELIIEDSLSRLRDAGHLDLDDFDVLLNFRVSCGNCGNFIEIVDLLDDEGCKCLIVPD